MNRRSRTGEVSRTLLDDLEWLLTLVQSFYVIDGHDYDAQRDPRLRHRAGHFRQGAGRASDNDGGGRRA